MWGKLILKKKKKQKRFSQKESSWQNGVYHEKKKEEEKGLQKEKESVKWHKREQEDGNSMHQTIGSRTCSM